MLNDRSPNSLHGGFVPVEFDSWRHAPCIAFLPHINTRNPKSTESNHGPARGHVVLVVEDEQGILHPLADCLKLAGYEVLPASCCKEALSFLELERVELAIIDWLLKGPLVRSPEEATGATVLKKCREMDPLMPVIVITGSGFDIRTDALMGEADSFLEKPFSPMLLVNHVSRWMKWLEAHRQPFHFDSPDGILPLERLKRRYVNEVVDYLHGNVSLAAKKLQVHRHTVASLRCAESHEPASWNEQRMNAPLLVDEFGSRREKELRSE